jgi:hypothetical protein
MKTERDSEKLMDCAEFRDLLHELDRPGTRGASALDGAMAHAEACGDCGVLLVEEESLGFALQKIAHETARMPGALRVEAALLNEFRQVKAEVMIPARNRARWGAAALGVAAAVLLVLGAAIYQRNFAHTPLLAVTHVAGNPAPRAADAKVEATIDTKRVTAENSTTSVTQLPSSNTPGARAVPGAKRAASEAQRVEYATAFVPLPYADDPSALEGGSVVRVTLARSVLESYGLPADGMGTGDRVTADMIVSEDGTPQAIRLVAQED